ncbi:MAG: AAA family ATPase [archaeon]|nr:AAA family ATPase [archaeon]
MRETAEYKAIPIGVDSFKKIRERDYYYVDKSELISDILGHGARINIITRPRRFGKTLNLSMLDCFFNIEYRGNDWFDGLEISRHNEVRIHKNAYPVIKFDMKDLSTKDYGRFVSKLGLHLSDLYGEYGYLSGKIEDPSDSDRFERTRWQKLTEEELQDSIRFLCRLLESYHGAAPIILIDEYDHIYNSPDKGDCEDISGFVQEFYSSTFKNNRKMKFAVITGLMPFVKETVFSDNNDILMDNVFTEQFDGRYGFTASEVMALCKHHGHKEKFKEAKEWYEGYLFGNTVIYNPWSILNYVGTGFRPRKYWADTSGNEIINTLLEHADGGTFSELMSLGNEQSIEIELPQVPSMRHLSTDPDAIYSVMVMAGYLDATPVSGRFRISIPNMEIRKVFNEMMMAHVHPDAETAFGNLFDGMENRDIPLIEKSLKMIMDRSIPFILLSKEKDQQSILGAISMGRLGRYTVSLVKGEGDGGTDIVLRSNRKELPNILLGLKKTDTDELTKEARNALLQIKEKEYFRGMKGNTILYGMCFKGKMSAIEMEEIVQD